MLPRHKKGTFWGEIEETFFRHRDGGWTLNSNKKGKERDNHIRKDYKELYGDRWFGQKIRRVQRIEPEQSELGITPRSYTSMPHRVNSRERSVG